MTAQKKSFLAGGALVGAANGLFGGGGGMVAVPLLRRAALSDASAHATALAVIFPVCCVSAAIYLFSGFVAVAVLVPVALGVFAGGSVGARLLPRLPAPALRFAFAALMLAAGLWSVF